MAIDPYKVLGVPNTASTEEIRKAYRKLAKKNHPDLNPGNKEAEKRFKEINTANEILSNPDLRKKFDQGDIDGSGTAQQTHSQEGDQENPFYYYDTQKNGGRYSSSFSSDDFDNDFFKSFFKGARARTHEQTRGKDQTYDLDVDFRDAILGAEYEVTLNAGKKIKVKIPAGIESGTKLRIKEQGAPDLSGGQPGDAFLRINVRPSSQFRRTGQNLEMELPISLSESILGGEVRVSTLDTPVLLKIPAGSSSGTKLRIRGKGVPATKNSPTPGDLLVILKIVMPRTIDPELQEAIGKWSKNHYYDPRSNFR